MRGACDSEGAELNRTQSALLRGASFQSGATYPSHVGVTWVVIPGTSRAGGIKV